MKSIKQIFKDNPELMDISEVNELIEYCSDLEGIVIENRQNKQPCSVLLIAKLQ